MQESDQVSHKTINF